MIVEIYGGFRPGHIIFETEQEVRDLVFCLNHLSPDIEGGRVGDFRTALLRQIYKLYPHLRDQGC